MKVNSNSFVALVCLVFLLACRVKGDEIFDVSKMGAKPDSEIDEILKSTWEKACASPTRSQILVPDKAYRLSEAKLVGPCKSPIEFTIQGVVQAPSKPTGEAMFTFRYIDQLTVSGNGVFDGNGESAWKKNDCDKNKQCVQLPMNIKFSFITNSVVKGITSLNSKNFQINVHGCTNLTFQDVKVIAPDESPNTDGIHISSSDDIHVLDTTIGTGDDCISIGDKITNLFITNVTCGPGHGISIGSLGRNTKEKEINGIFVKNCKFNGTDNGVRIKTWPNSPIISQVNNVSFEDIEMTNVRWPVVIDQEYCPYDKCNKKVPSKVKIRSVSFKNIKGTSSDEVAVKIICSKTYPCKDIKFTDIDLTLKEGGNAKSQCLNVDNPIISGKQIPEICAERAPSVMT